MDPTDLEECWSVERYIIYYESIEREKTRSPCPVVVCLLTPEPTVPDTLSVQDASPSFDISSALHRMACTLNDGEVCEVGLCLIRWYWIS